MVAIYMRKFLRLVITATILASVFSGWTTRVNAQVAEKPGTASDAEGDKAWKDLEKAANTPPVPPVEWRDKQPTEEEINKFRAVQRNMTVGIADKAKEFYTRFPKHPKAAEARTREREFVKLTLQLGGTNQLARLESLEQEQLKDPGLSAEEKFQLRVQAVHRAAIAKKPEGQDVVMAEFEKGTRVLLKDFPGNPEVYSMLWIVASNSGDEKARAIADELVKDPAGPEELKIQARGFLKKMDALGKPVAIQFTALDGRKIDLTNMKGKVVLVDFWATWCGTCIAMLPSIKTTYEKLHAKGFEVVGISFDYTKEAMVNFVAEEKIPWPQYYDGEGKYGKEYAVRLLPEMWLIDKKGNLRYMKAHADLEQKVEKLLAE
jgi:thiol-disulfide isomerase/thioredoxin